MRKITALRARQRNNPNAGEKGEEMLVKPKSGSEGKTLWKEKTWVCDAVVHFIKL